MDEMLKIYIEEQRKEIIENIKKSVEHDFVSQPGYKKGMLKKYKTTEAYQKAIQNMKSTNHLYNAFFGDEPENNPIILEKFEKACSVSTNKWGEEKLRKEMFQWLEEQRDNIVDTANSIIDDIVTEAIETFEKKFLYQKVEFTVHIMDDYRFDRWYESRIGDKYFYEDEVSLNIDNWNDFVEYVKNDFYDGMFTEKNIADIWDHDSLISVILEMYEELNPEIVEKYCDCDIYEYLMEIIDEECDYYYNIPEQLQNHFSMDTIVSMLRKNSNYKGMFEEMDNKKYMQQLLANALKNKIPENPVELFPLARTMKRKIILHVGPTNSGKTHEAIQKMKEASTGIYLAPLRLMAYEMYERLNKEGIPCTMETGEECKETDNAKHFSKTIELFEPFEKYEVAVIDEAQMIADISRGGAWSNAIIGMCASEIHICMSPDAEQKIVSILKDCNDEIEIVRHERMTQLELDTQNFKFPESVKKGDALIVFSKKNVIACAAELQDKGYRCSIIYGALPYDVRQEEVRKFAEGETDVVVATDAIGMGMNLPVHRVVFLETKKYDGSDFRNLKESEIKQIAGRAGRYGLYDIGLYNAEYNKKLIHNGVMHGIQRITDAILSFPESVIMIDGKLSDIMKQWKDMPDKPGYKKTDISSLLLLTEKMEDITNDKHIAYSYATIPFDTKNEELLRLWWRLVNEIVDDGPSQLYLDDYIVNSNNVRNMLHELEYLYARYDLLYNFARRTKNVTMMEKIMVEKEKISKYIIEILKKNKLPRRTCKYCNKTLAWNYPYGMCSQCHDKMYGNRYNDYDDEDWF